MRKWTAVVVLLCAVGAAAPSAHAEDRKAAAEHFALAEAAEKRKDWASAIGEYELAYAASPHPWALYNIAANYQRLGQQRSAADYFRRYLKESPDAKDRAEVVARIESLRSQASQVTITARPTSAKVFVDGEDAGSAPLTVGLPGGKHTVYISHAGRRSPDRDLSVEYGEPISLTVDLDTAPGLLMVDGTVEGAEIRLDGEVIGYTPYSGAVTAGPHQLLVSKPGYRSVQRDLTIVPDGSQKIRANLESVDGAAAKPEARARYLLGMGYGFDAKTDGIRYMFELGYRAGSGRWEVSALFGTVGGLGGGIGIGGRLYITTGRIRPYLHAAALLASASSTGGNRRTLLEGGAGVLIVGGATRQPSSSSTPRIGMSFAYFVEVDVNAQLAEPAANESRFGVPIIGGILLQYGR